MKNSIKITMIALGLAAAVSACSSNKKTADTTTPATVETQAINQNPEPAPVSREPIYLGANSSGLSL